MSKFKVGDRVISTWSYNNGEIGYIKSINKDCYRGFSDVGDDFDGYLVLFDGNRNTVRMKSTEIKLIEEKSCKTNIPLTNTIITDIKNETQHKRVQEKLFSMGNYWIGEKVNTFYSPDKDDIKQIALDDKGRMWVDCTISGGGKHITANDFLQEVDEIQPFHFDRPLPDKITVDKNTFIGMDFGVDIKQESDTKMVRGRTKAEQHMADIIRYYKTSPTKVGDTNKINMNNNSIVNFFNDLTVSAEDKELRKAGLKNSELQWTNAARQIVENLEAKELGFKNMEKLDQEFEFDTDTEFSTLEYQVLFTKYYTKLLDTAKKFNRKDDKKTK